MGEPTISGQPQRDLWVVEEKNTGKKAVVHVKGTFDEQEISRAAQSVFQHREFVNDQKITLWKDSENITHAKSGGKEFSVVASNTEQVVLRRITSQNVASINQAKIRETIKRGVLHILISPLLALIRQVTGKAKVAQSFIEEANCKNYAGFSSLLSTAERVVGSEHMRAASALAGRIQLAHSSKGESLQEIAESIIEDVNNGKTVNIPSGYYDDTNTFRPIILECSKGVIELYGSEPKEALRTTFTGDLNTKLLVRLLERTQPPQAISQVAKKKISVFAGSSEQPSAVTSSQVSAFQALNTLITNEGFAVGQTVKLALAETSAQGLLWGLLEKTAIDAPQIAKAHFMLELMGEHLSTVIQKIGSFSDRDQVAILQALLTEYDQAKALCEQEFGLKKGLDAVVGLADLDAIVQKVRSRLASLQLHLEKKASNRRDYDLQAASSVSRSTVQITPTEKKQATPIAQDDSHDAKLKNLEQAINSQNVQETIQALQTVAKSLDSLIESKQYAQVIAVATKALGYLPVPSSPYAADQNTLWAKVEPSDVTACQQALHDVVKLLWEAKLQNGDTHCSSNELVGMSLAEAAVLRLMLTRGIAAEKRIIEKLIERKDDPKISLLLRRLGCYEESSEADFKQALLINTRDNACIRGLLCRELGLPFEICADSLYRFFPNSNSALTALLVTDRFALSYSKENHSKVALLRDFYDTPLWGGRGEQAGGKIGLYDQALAKCYGAYSSSLEVTDKTTEESIEEALELYRDSKRSFSIRYENGKQVKTPMKEEYKLEELRSQLKSSVASLKGDEALLPATLEIQNALQVMSESMIYPESLLRLYDGLFEYKKDEKYTSRLNAIKEELEKVGKIDPKDAAWHRQIVQEGLSSMGRINVVPMDNDIVGDRGIGLRFPSEFHWRRFPKNPTNSEGEVGEVDSKLTEALVASHDKQHSRLSGIYSSDRSVRQEYTEEGTLASIAASENDPDMMYRLFSLRVAGENGDFHHSSALHALQFILDYPEKLNNPSIKRYVEATLFRPPLLLEASAQIPEAFKARLLQLEPLLDRAIKAEELELAAYLIHVGSSLEQFLGVPTVDSAKKTQLAKWLRDSLEPVTQKTIQFALYYLDRVRLKGFEASDKPLMMEAYKLLQATPLGSDIVALHKEVLDWMQMTISSDERLAARQANVAGMNTVIVPEIARHPDFMAVFGPRIFSGTITENSQTHITYKCRVEGKEFELAYDKRSQSLTIKQFVDGAWYRFCHVDAPNAAHTDICLSHYNCWVDDGNKNAFVFLDDQVDWHPENRITATLTSKGHFDSLRIGDKLLGFDSKGEKTRWLSCFHPSRILLEKDAKGKVAAIRILGTDIVLEKQNSIWQQHGFEWVAPSDAEILQPATRNLLKHIGKAVDDVAVVLKGKEADKVLIVPHVITGVVKEVETSQVTLEFEKEDISEVLVKPLEVSIENGRVETSCAGFLYLAELAACQKNLKQALFYLEEASKRTLLPEDAKTFTQVAASLDVLPANTLRSAAFKLKAYLFVSHLQRSYMVHSGLQVGREQEFVSSARKITALYRQYTAAYGAKNRIPKELELTTAELAECNHIANEALEDLVKAAPSKPITRPAAEEIGALIPYLAVFAQAAKGPLGLPPKPDLSLLGRFTEYYDLAKNKKEITQQDIDQLFTAVSSSYTADVQKAIDTARRILHIAFNENSANQNDANQNSASFVPDKEPFVPGKFHADLLSLQKWLPKKEVKSPLQALLAVPSMKKIADLQRRFADEFPGGQMQEGAQELEETVQLTSQVVSQREKELRARIEERKSSLQGALESRATGAIKVEPNSWLAVVDLPSHFKAASRERRGEISERQRATYFPDTIEASDPMHAMKAEENALQQEGICAAIGDFEREQSDRVLLTNKSELQDQVVARLAILSLEVSALGEKIQQLVLLAKKDNPEIRELLRNRAMFGQEQFLERLFKIYQKQQGTGNQKLDSAITSFLIKGVEQIHLEKARERLKNYNDVHADKVVLASEIKQLLETATKHDRYNDKEPAIARKYLVAEFTRGIVLRPGQILAIEEIRQNPNRLMQLRMGLGKTSYILPIAMQILAEEKGLLPIALVPQGLFAMNRRDMDATTRKLFQQAAYELRVTDDVLSNSMLLAQELDRLYEVKQNKGYIIASIEQIAAIEHALTQCDEQLVKKPSVELENRRQWLCQIRTLLQDKGTQFFADEADEVFSINKEINIALPGGDRSPDEAIVEAGQKLILHILETDHTQPSLQMLKKALLEGKQASLPKTLLHEAVGELRAFSASQDGVVKIAIQKMLAGPFIDILQRNPEVDYGFLSASGCTTGPRSEKKEKPNMKFGDEYELVLYNVINYINKAPSREFLVSTIRSLRLNNQERYHALQELARVAGKSPQESMEAIIAYLEKGENWKARLEILDKDVLRAGLVTFSKEQLILNVQDIIRGKNCGGISGTMTPYSLPEGFDSRQQRSEARKVEGETWVKLASAFEKGLDHPVEVIEDDRILSALAIKAKDPHVKALINMGLSIEGKDAIDIAESLHKNSGRPIVFVHPAKGLPFIVEEGKAPEPLGDRPILENYVVFYDPADKRGTDFKIPPGKAIYVPGPTTTTEQFCQGVWRMRQLGFSQSAEALVPKSIATRIKALQGREEQASITLGITLGDLIVDIQAKTVDQQPQKNCKAQIVQIKGIAFTGLRDILYDPANEAADNKILYPLFRSYYVQKKEPDFSYSEAPDINTLEMLAGICDGEVAFLAELCNKVPEAYKPKIQKLIEAVVAKKQQYVDAKSEHQKQLSATTKGSFSTSSGTQSEQMQQQQQQQQQQVQQEQKVKASGLIDEAPFHSPFSLSQFNDESSRSLDPSEERVLNPAFMDVEYFLERVRSRYPGLTHEQIVARIKRKQEAIVLDCSPSAREILLRQSKYSGSGAFMLGVYERHGEVVIRILSKNDQVGLHAEKVQSKKELDQGKLTIYSLDRNVEPSRQTGVTVVESITKEPPELTEKAVALIAVARFFLGHEPLTKFELQAIKNNKEAVQKAIDHWKVTMDEIGPGKVPAIEALEAQISG